MHRQGLFRLVRTASAAALIAGTIAVVGLVSPAIAAPACTFNGSSTVVTGVSGGTAIAISCTGLPASTSVVFAEASPLAALVPSSSASSEADLSAIVFATSDASGNVSGTFTVPATFTATDTNAVCPPTQAEVNAGLVGCAVAVATLTGTNFGDAILQYTGQPTPAAPSLTLSPTSGAVGDTITVSGSNWWGNALAATAIPAANISVGGVAASTASVNVSAATYSGVGGTLTPPAISGTFVVPTGVASGSQTVAIDEPNSTPVAGNGPGNTVEGTASLTIAAPAPTVTGVSPSSGPEAGGTVVTITGTNLTGGTVDFGPNAATGVTCGATSCTATSPAGTGTVDVTVTTAGGTSATSPADQFTYTTTTPAPTVTGISPTSGPAAGGTVVTITGTNLTGGTVDFGPNAATGVTCGATSCTATSPAGTGTVDVTVTTAGGTSATSSADQFTYISKHHERACNPHDVIVNLSEGDVVVNVDSADIHVHHGNIVVHIDKNDLTVNVPQSDISFKPGCDPTGIVVHVDADDVHVHLDSDDIQVQGNTITVQPQLDDIHVHVSGDDITHLS